MSDEEQGPGGARGGASPTGHWIVIDEDLAESNQTEPPREGLGAAVVIETEITTPITPAAEEPATSPAPTLPRQGARTGIWALGSLAILIIALLVTWLVELVRSQFLHHGPIGWMLLPLSAATLILSATWICQEVLRWRRLVSADRLRSDLSDTGSTEADRMRFLKALRHLAVTMGEPEARAIATFLARHENDDRGADELRIIFEGDVLAPMDQAALEAIRKAVQQGFFLGLVSPTVIMDTLSFAVRAIAMVRAVSVAYGHRPGKIGVFRLLRHMVADVALLSSVMVIMRHGSHAIGKVANAGSKWVGGGIGFIAGLHAGPHGAAAGAALGSKVGETLGEAASAVGEEFADAMAAALRMAQLGLLAIAVARPIVLGANDRSRLARDLRTMLFSLGSVARGKSEPQPTADVS